MSLVPSWWTWSLAPWTRSALAHLDKSSGQIILCLVCLLQIINPIINPTQIQEAEDFKL